LFCHSPYTCSAETLRKSKQTARQLETLFFIHLAEVRSEVDTIQKKHGTSPALYLDSLGVLDEHTVAVHCIWLNDEDVEAIAARKTNVSHTPESSMKLASGVPLVVELLEHGITVSLGTDGCASNNDLDMFQEMDVATKLQKVHRLNPTVLPAEDVVWMSTMGGAKALGLDHQIGSLEKGKRADIVLLNMRKPHLVPLYDYYSQIVYAAKGSDVETVIIDGEIILENRSLLSLDMEEVYSRVIPIAEAVTRGLKG
jgi:5-methylthioadenosine/S-adenosylhomocysteine deaminase